MTDSILNLHYLKWSASELNVGVTIEIFIKQNYKIFITNLLIYLIK